MDILVLEKVIFRVCKFKFVNLNKEGYKMSNKSIELIINKLKKYSVPESREGMAKYGINTGYALGVSIPNLRKTAKEIGKKHILALSLWKTKIHEARILASMIDSLDSVSEEQMDFWVKDFDSWDLCDQCCNNLFGKSKFAFKKAVEWSKRKEEFIKRAGFVLMAVLAVHNKESKDKEFIKLLYTIEKECTDDRNFVKKAVNWALRQIGKRNRSLNKLAIKTAEKIINQNQDYLQQGKAEAKSACWVASDALRELKNDAVQRRLNRKHEKI